MYVLNLVPVYISSCIHSYLIALTLSCAPRLRGRLLVFDYLTLWVMFERGTAIEQPQVAGDVADKNTGCPAPNAFRVGALVLGCVLGCLLVPGIVSDIQSACGPNAPRGNLN